MWQYVLRGRVVSADRDAKLEGLGGPTKSKHLLFHSKAIALENNSNNLL